ncbi:sulfatase family protein [Polycladidibacter hongkongensis]|uniref:sulfatase family protein n=1 Tax=Polycladidibacter hongkongensis TaxID=1647556 RepID=UPI0008304145|nr:sulfatase [Pseudovibrio hongkongensis]
MQPNILFIMADDHAAKAISCYGAGLNTTPNLDRLATEGMRLDHCYVTNSICTPSRASILTGNYNHVNGVTTLDTHLNNRVPHLAKHLQRAGYQTGLFGKWHLGEGPEHQPTGFDAWSVLPGQGDYFDPRMIDKDGSRREPGYVTDIITDKTLNFLEERNTERPFFVMCHHKAPHRSFIPHPKHNHLLEDEDVRVPDTFDDDYKTRSRAATNARMRIREDMIYDDLGLAQPEGGAETGELLVDGPARLVPHPKDLEGFKLVDKNTGEVFTFTSQDELAHFKYQRYIKRYLRTIASVDENVGRLLDYLDDNDLTENTIVIYTSDQGFFLGEHGWFDKRFMYEESLQMPFLIRYPQGIRAGSTSSDIATNVDFAPTLLDYAGQPTPTYMQGTSLRPLLEERTDENWQDIAYHRYWMHGDENHNAYAHYGVRDQRYKLIYWYNDGLDQPGAFGMPEQPEWELFDCQEDPLELHNLAGNASYDEVFQMMLAKLDAKMAEVGDIPEHSSPDVLANRAKGIRAIMVA